MFNPKFACFDILAVSYQWDSFDDVHEEYFEHDYDEMNEEDFDQNRAFLESDLCSPNVIFQVWATNPEEALEKAARLMGHKDSVEWLVYLNLGDERFSLETTLSSDPNFELYEDQIGEPF